MADVPATLRDKKQKMRRKPDTCIISGINARMTEAVRYYPEKGMREFSGIPV